MSTILSLFVVGSIIIVGLLAQFIFKKFRIPEVLVLISFGALISHFGIVSEIDTGDGALLFLITFSLIYVVFYGALPISIRAIFSTLKFAFFSSLLNFFAITVIVAALSIFLGVGLANALIIGALFCVLDGSIINSLLSMIRIGKRAEAQIQIESAIIDTIVIVGVLSIINFQSMTAPQIVQSLSSYLFLSFGIGLTAALVWAFVVDKIRNYSSAPIATMAVLVLLYAFGEFVKANGVITVFAFAIVFGNVNLLTRIFYKGQAELMSPIDFKTKSFFRDISFLIRSFLFVYLGILLDLTQWKYLLIGLGFFLLAYTIRSVIGTMMRNRALDKRENYLVDAMCAKGLTPTVMIAVIQGSTVLSNIVIGGIFSSVLFSSLFIFLIQHDLFTSAGDYLVRFNHFVRKKLRRF